MKETIKIANLVVGGSLAALEFAFREGFPVIYEKLEIPFHLEQTKEGISKKDIIQNYAFLLSMAGLNYYSHLNNSFRINKNKLTISGNKPWIKEVIFESLHDFREKYRSKKVYKVVDYINVRSCGPHDVRELRTEDRFVKEIYFYPSQRMNASKNFSLGTHNYETVQKDVMVVSYLKGGEIEKEDFSPIYSRLRLKEIMKEAGIKGKKCGFAENGSQKYNPVKLEFSKREVNEIEEDERNYYYSQSKDPYLNRLYEHLYGRNS